MLLSRFVSFCFLFSFFFVSQPLGFRCCRSTPGALSISFLELTSLGRLSSGVTERYYEEMLDVYLFVTVCFFGGALVPGQLQLGLVLLSSLSTGTASCVKKSLWSESRSSAAILFCFPVDSASSR